MTDDIFESAIREILMDILLVLYKHGIREVHLGSLMRLIGVTEESASEHDDEVLEITDEFAKYMRYVTEKPTVSNGGKTIH